VEILGIRTETIATGEGNEDALRPFEQAVDFILEMRRTAKANKDWATSDLIRDRLAQIGFDIKDTKDGFEWSLK
jgi:cysteinyl-tRNA synthetase